MKTHIKGKEGADTPPPGTTTADKKAAPAKAKATGGDVASAARAGSPDALRSVQSAGPAAAPQLTGPVPLAPVVRSQMESAFGANFSNVQVFIDSDEVPGGALAFTRGHEIHFAPGAYDPVSSDGQRLIAHELTHVIQQRAGRAVKGAQGQFEAEADQVADAVVRGDKATVAGGESAGSEIQNQAQQYYHIVRPEDYSLGANSGFESGQLVTDGQKMRHQRTELRVGEAGAETGTKKTSEYKRNAEGKGYGEIDSKVSGLPELRVAHQGKMAVEHTDAQTRILYAAADIAAASNETLAAAGAKARLKPTGDTMTVPKTPGAPNAEQTQALVGYKPAHEVKVEDDKTELQFLEGSDFESDECIHFIKNVIGSMNRARVAVFGSGENEVEVKSREGNEFHNVVANEVIEGTSDPQAMVDAIYEHGHRTTDERHNYGVNNDLRSERKYMNDDRDADQMQSLGLNEHAAPEVGEGYVLNSHKPTINRQAQTRTFRAPDARGDQLKKALDGIAALNPQADIMKESASNDERLLKTGVWGNHYAGVVAKVGGDSVTLENYNRQQEKDWASRQLFLDLYRDFADFRTLVWESTEALKLADMTADKGLFQTIVGKVEARGEELAELAAAVAQAKLSMTEHLNADSDTKKSMWYFAMYGEGEQSFHAQFQGASALAVTERIRNSPKHLGFLITDRFDTLNSCLSPVTDAGAALVLTQAKLKFVGQKAAFAGLIEAADGDATALNALNMTGSAAAKEALKDVVQKLQGYLHSEFSGDGIRVDGSYRNLHADVKRVAGTYHVGMRMFGRDEARRRKALIQEIKPIAAAFKASADNLGV